MMPARVKKAPAPGFVSPLRNSLAFDPEQGKIYSFNPRRIEVVRLGKPYPAAWLKTDTGGAWQNRIPSGSFPFLFSKPWSYNRQSENEALQKYLALAKDLYSAIALHVGEERVRMLEQYNRRSWFLYCLLENGGDYAMDLMRTNPALAYLLSAHGVFHTLAGKRYWRSVRSLLRKKRRDILGYFCFPESEAAVKLMARIPPGSCNNELFFILRKKLGDSPELLRQLSFYPSHNNASLMILCSKLRPNFDFHAIHQLGTLDSDEGNVIFRQVILDILRMRGVLESNGITPPRLFIRSLDEISAIHDELVEVMNRTIRVDEREYVDAPLADVNREAVRIQNIRRASELHQEGREMHHCIYSYHEMICRGDYFAARMLAPERLTILYRPDFYRPQGELELVDARGVYNAAPRESSLRIIRQWLRKIDFASYDPDQMTIFGEEEFAGMMCESG